MKRTLFISLTGCLLALGASAQIATFDYDDVVKVTNTTTPTWNLDADTQDNCVTGATATKNGIANSIANYGICTAGWSVGSNIDWTKTLDLDLSFAPSTTGSIDSVTFLANKFNADASPQRWAMRLLKDGVAIGAVQTGSFANTGSSNFGANTATFNQAIMASSDYTVQFTAFGGPTAQYLLVNSATVNGSLNCIPEPSSVLLSTLALVALLTNRKRK